MDELIFYVTFLILFVLQFVGHHVGDYLFQSHYHATKKSTDWVALISHSFIYSLVVSTFVAISFAWYVALVVLVLTFIEHVIVDSRKPVIWWKTFSEKHIFGNKDFDIKELPLFVIISIDQTFHLVRILILSFAISYWVNL